MNHLGNLTDKHTVHSYIPFYQGLLYPFKNKPCTLVEIGMYFGGSLLIWMDLLHKGTIYGVDTEDIVEPRVIDKLDADRVRLMFGNGYSSEIIDSLPELDFAIDDGPHTLFSQIAFLRTYLPKLKDGGIAIVEDIQDTQFIPILTAEIPPGYRVDVMDFRYIKGRYDDVLLVVTRED